MSSKIFFNKNSVKYWILIIYKFKISNRQIFDSCQNSDTKDMSKAIFFNYINNKTNLIFIRTSSYQNCFIPLNLCGILYPKFEFFIVAVRGDDSRIFDLSVDRNDCFEASVDILSSPISVRFWVHSWKKLKWKCQVSTFLSASFVFPHKCRLLSVSCVSAIALSTPRRCDKNLYFISEFENSDRFQDRQNGHHNKAHVFNRLYPKFHEDYRSLS